MTAVQTRMVRWLMAAVLALNGCDNLRAQYRCWNAEALEGALTDRPYVADPAYNRSELQHMYETARALCPDAGPPPQ